MLVHVALACLLAVPLILTMCALAAIMDRRNHAAFMAGLREGQSPEWLASVDAKAKSYVPGSGNLTGY